MPPPRFPHGLVEMRLGEALSRYVYRRAVNLGWDETQGWEARDRLVGRIEVGEAGIRFSLPDDPDQVRGVDVLYLTPDQVARLDQMPEAEYIPFVPALLVEVISPSDRPDRVATKVRDYLAGGAQLVWLFDPSTRTVTVHQPDGTSRVVPATAVLDGGEALPGFAVAVGDLFPTRRTGAR